MSKRYFYLAAAVLTIFLFMPLQCMAEEAQAPAASVVTQSAEEMSLYGEVIKVDTASNTMSVQYYDYDTDEEITADIVLNKETKVENAAGLEGIKKADWVDVTYQVTDGKKTAKSVIVEKEEIEESAEDAPNMGKSETPDNE